MIGAKTAASKVQAAASTRKVATSAKVAGVAQSARRFRQVGSSKSAFNGVKAASLTRAMSSATAKRSTKLAARAEVGNTLEEFLEKNTDDLKLRQLMLSMGEAVRTIAYKVRTASCNACRPKPCRTSQVRMTLRFFRPVPSPEPVWKSISDAPRHRRDSSPNCIET